jgi:hypothetical protein
MRYVYFYQVFFVSNSKPISLSVKDLLSRINAIEYPQRIIEIDGSSIVLNSTYTEKSTGLDFYTMVKFKKNAPVYTGSLTESSLNEIVGDLAEVTTFLYDETKNLMLLEYNHEGVKQKELKTYLQQFLKNTDIELHFTPIDESYSLDMLTKTSRIASIDIRIRLDKIKMDLFKERHDDFDTFSGIFDAKTSNTLDADTVSIIFKKDRNRTLNIESAITFLHILNVDDEAIESIQVQFKLGRKIVSMNVKDFDKPLKDTILEDSEMKTPFIFAVRTELQLLYLDKYAGRFDEIVDVLFSKMEEYGNQIEYKIPVRQIELTEA